VTEKREEEVREAFERLVASSRAPDRCSGAVRGIKGSREGPGNAQSPIASTLPVEIVANVVDGVVAYHVTIAVPLV
jgi:hypothetical protein